MLEQIKLSKLIKDNFRGNRGNFIIKFTTGKDVELEEYSAEQIIFPYSENLKIISYRNRRAPGKRETEFLVMPESVFTKLASEMESSGFFPYSIELQGQKGEAMTALSAEGLITYDLIFKFLKNGFSFHSCIFRKDNMILGVERFSRIWSNDRDLISTTGEIMAQYISEALKNFSLFSHSEAEGENTLVKPYIADYIVDSESFANIKLRLGQRRIFFAHKFRNKDVVLYAYASSKSHRIQIFFKGNALNVVSMESTDLNTLIEISEIVEKAGGIFVGNRPNINSTS